MLEEKRMAVSKKMRDLYWGFFDGIETTCNNVIERISDRKYRHKHIDTDFKFTKEQKAEIKSFWKKWGGIDIKWPAYYIARNGIYDYRYVPDTLYYTKIDQHFNNRKLGWGFNDKNYYSRIFLGIKQPKTIARRIGGILLSDDYRIITLDDLLSYVKNEGNVIIKPALENGGGKGIVFWDESCGISEVKELVTKTDYDFVIQGLIKQHEELARIHKSSINSIRICSLIFENKVNILSACLRMGRGDAKVDNAHSGGISVAINENGWLAETAYNVYGEEACTIHPDGVVFKGFRVPNFDKAIELVQRAHQMIPHFKLVSWDIAIDDTNEAVLIEANMRKGGIDVIQFNSGPIFGDLTEKVLDEVFKK
jgi:hypothetical protein